MGIKSFDAFAGVGGFTMALERCGIETIGFSEVDKYASAVLKYHWPNIPNYGDITKINPKDLPDFDLFTFGSPCQDFSVAGKRAGIDGGRSGLLLKALEIIEEKKPRYILFENVRGLLSSNKGWDMARAFIEMEQAGYSLWWQVLNAKDFGVPQNRERIFVVGTRNGSPREVFFEAGNGGQDSESDKGRSSDICPTIRATHYKSGDNQPLIKQLNSPKHSNDRVYSDEGISPTLNTMQGGRRQPFIAAMRGRNPENPSDRTVGAPTEQRLEANEKGTSNTLTSVGKDNLVVDEPRIRRLTPSECMALMSWPRDWCDYGIFDGETKEISNTQRYKMAGNGVVSDVVAAIVKAHLL